MNNSDRSGVISFADCSAGIPGPAGERSFSFLQRGTLNVKLSRPVPPNRQAPHAQDELYIVVNGRGVLVHGGRRDPFGTGDLLFVAAGEEHCFEDFSEDLAIWVVFYGPQGGEVPA